MKLSESKISKKCNAEIDTLKHAFLECSTTVKLWKQIEEWAKAIISRNF